MHQNRTMSGKYRFGLVCGVFAMASVVALSPFSAQAEIKINPYPKKAMPFAQVSTQPVAPISDSSALTQQVLPQDLPENVFVDRGVVIESRPSTVQSKAPAALRRSDMQGAPDESVQVAQAHGTVEENPLVDRMAARKRRFTDPGKNVGPALKRRGVGYTDLKNLPEPTYGSRPVRSAPVVSAPVADVPAVNAPEDMGVDRVVPVLDTAVPGVARVADGAPVRLNAQAVMKARDVAAPTAVPVPVSVSVSPQDMVASQIVERSLGPQPDLKRPAGAPPAPVLPQWHAFEGASVKETLEVWSQKEGVEFVWNGSHVAFDVMHSGAFVSSYEEAVRTLLDQYRNSFVRPVGRLFVSPHNGKRVLVVDVSNGV